jgi:hypothetical protein
VEKSHMGNVPINIDYIFHIIVSSKQNKVSSYQEEGLLGRFGFPLDSLEKIFLVFLGEK